MNTETKNAAASLIQAKQEVRQRRAIIREQQEQLRRESRSLKGKDQFTFADKEVLIKAITVTRIRRKELPFTLRESSLAKIQELEQGLLLLGAFDIAHGYFNSEYRNAKEEYIEAINKLIEVKAKLLDALVLSNQLSAITVNRSKLTRLAKKLSVQ